MQDQLGEWDLTLLELEQAGPEDVAHKISRRHWTWWQLEEPEAARLMALWSLIDRVASMAASSTNA